MVLAIPAGFRLGLGIDPLQIDLMGGAELTLSTTDYSSNWVKAFPPMGAMPLSMDRP